MTNKYLVMVFSFVLLFDIGCQENNSEAVVRAGLSRPLDEYVRNPPEKATVKNVDLAKSIIKWKGSKMLYTKKHEGTVKLKAGELFFHEDRLIGGYIVSDMKSIKVTDMPAHETVPIANLTKHLNSDFDTRSYPTSKFELVNIEYLTKTSLKVDGKLTIKDVTKDITVSASAVINKQMQLRFESEFVINRVDWNIGIGGSWLEEMLVDDEIELQIELVTK